MGREHFSSIGLDVRALDTPQRVQREADEMLHCIHTYQRQLALLPWMAFALGVDGRPDRSTLLVGYERAINGGWFVRILQHRGPSNQTPNPRSHAAASKLCEFLMSLALHKAIEAADRARIERVQMAVLHGELDPDSRAAAEVRAQLRVVARQRAVKTALEAMGFAWAPP